MEIKKILSTLLSILFCAVSFAQNVPQGINYQAVARDANGDVLMNQAFPHFNNDYSYVGRRPPFPIYNFTYHNLGSSSNTTLQITKISN